MEFRPEDRVFITITSEPAKSLYQAMIEDLLIKAKLREGASGGPRSVCCFQHTYATFRLAEGVDVYFLADQMGTSVKMIEEHYGHVNTVKHADLVSRAWAAGTLARARPSLPTPRRPRGLHGRRPGRPSPAARPAAASPRLEG